MSGWKNDWIRVGRARMEERRRVWRVKGGGGNWLPQLWGQIYASEYHNDKVLVQRQCSSF